MQTFILKRIPGRNDDFLTKWKQFISSQAAYTISSEDCGSNYPLQSFQIFDIPDFKSLSFRFTRIDDNSNDILCEVFDEAAEPSMSTIDASRDRFFSPLLSSYSDVYHGENFSFGAIGAPN